MHRSFAISFKKIVSLNFSCFFLLQRISISFFKSYFWVNCYFWDKSAIFTAAAVHFFRLFLKAFTCKKTANINELMWKIEIQILQKKRKSSICIIKKQFCCWNTILSHRQLIQLDTVCGLLSFVYVKFHGIIKFHWIIFAYVSQQQPSTSNGFRKVFIGLLNDCHSFWHKLATKMGQYKAAPTEFNLFNLQMIPVALGIAL